MKIEKINNEKKFINLNKKLESINFLTEMFKYIKFICMNDKKMNMNKNLQEIENIKKEKKIKLENQRSLLVESDESQTDLENKVRTLENENEERRIKLLKLLEEG
ncbi:MAG: hypothetical protein BWY04_00504 [candidate division CPR1 bacterium ADurb.Bin160]|uniref:Uncharacterized protein n=1 Tax=candidate division CPR1 bacterium ADurb.Bin160 TaxID=1852826 RepID=A0A1V5ZPM4_9BACT|nr:MAG: hypothetical protein BWY04_00504 [candidate division CPR1 bacterium ADurb.Bin160]